MNTRRYALFFWTGVCLLVIPGLIHAYLLMPFPGSQDLEAITLVYYLEKCVWLARLLGLLLMAWPLWQTYTGGTKRQRWTRGLVLAASLGLFFFTDVKYKAERMFEEPQTVQFAPVPANTVPDSLLVIGLVHEGIAKAYPVNNLGYHHKVQDSVGTLPVLVTYCTMCRTGRVFSPVMNGKHQTFRLVGARHYNAIIEDEDTRTWWYQATGEAAVGPLKGQQLAEIPYEQVTLRTWLRRYPNSLVLQPDPHYQSGYEVLARYDRQQAVDRDSTLRTDSLYRKSWILGIHLDEQAKAYDWKKFVEHRIIHDQLSETPLLIALEDDSLSFHVFNRQVGGKVLHFERHEQGLLDTKTGSSWNWQGKCVSGSLQGNTLTRIQAHQEYWHSWQQFHSPTLLWRGETPDKPVYPDGQVRAQHE